MSLSETLSPAALAGTSETKGDAEGTIPSEDEKVRSYQLSTDCHVHRFIVHTLAGVIVITLLGTLYLTIFYEARQIPDIFVAFGSGALGALAGLLAPRSSRPGVNTPG